MSTRKDRRGRWFIDFQFERRRYRPTSPENTKAGAEAYEALLRQRLSRGEPVKLIPKNDKPIPTFKEYSDRWYKTYVVTNNKPAEQRRKRICLSAHLVPFFGHMRLDAIGNEQIELLKAKKQAQGLAPKTINNLLSVVGKCLNTAVEWGVIKTAPRMRRLRVPPESYDYLTEEEANQLVSSADEEPWRTMILLALKTGLRLGELVGLIWDDIDLKKRMLTVRRSVVNNIIDSPKSNRIRHIPLTQEVCWALQKMPERKGFILRLRDEGPMNHKAPPQAIQRMCKKAGLRRIGWHVLRHTFATHLAMKGVSLQKIQLLLGHSDPRVTLRYAHLAPSTLRDAIDVLEPLPANVMEIFGQPVGSKQNSSIQKVRHVSDS